MGDFPNRQWADVIVDGSYGGYSEPGAASSADDIGASDSQFDITAGAGDDIVYTFDGTGTDPGISVTSMRAGEWIGIFGGNFNVENNGLFKIKSVAANAFTVENASGVPENNVTIGAAGGIYLAKRYCVRSDEYTLTEDLVIKPGQSWLFDEQGVFCEVTEAGGLMSSSLYSNYYPSFESSIRASMAGVLTLHGEGKDANLGRTYAEMFIPRMNASKLELNIDSREVIASVSGSDIKLSVLGGDDASYKINILPHDVNIAQRAQGVDDGWPGTTKRLRLDLTVDNWMTSANQIIEGYFGNVSATQRVIRLQVEGVTSGSVAGVGAQVAAAGAQYSHYSGSIIGCDTAHSAIHANDYDGITND